MKRLELFSAQLARAVIESYGEQVGAPVHVKAIDAEAKVAAGLTWKLISALSHDIGYPYKVADWLDDEVEEFDASTHAFDGIDGEG